MTTEVPYKDSFLTSFHTHFKAGNFRVFKNINEPINMFDKPAIIDLFKDLDINYNEVFKGTDNHYNILMFGAGGVASWLLPQLLKLLYNYREKSTTKPTFEIKLIDFDIVEAPKNILRQNFIPSDVEENKAKVLASRYSQIYEGITVSYIDKYIIDHSFLQTYLNKNSSQIINEYPDTKYVSLNDLFNRISYNNLFIFNMMDNELSKHMLDNYLNRNWFLFSGTRYFCTGCDINHGLVYTTLIGYEELYTQYFKNSTFIEEDAQIETHSCAEVALEATIEQTFDSNSMAANLLSVLVSNCLSSHNLINTKQINFTSTVKPYVSTQEDNLADIIMLDKLYTEYAPKLYAYNARYSLEGKTTKAKQYKAIYDLLTRYLNITL